MVINLKKKTVLEAKLIFFYKKQMCGAIRWIGAVVDAFPFFFLLWRLLACPPPSHHIQLAPRASRPSFLPFLFSFSVVDPPYPAFVKSPSSECGHRLAQ